MMSQTQTIQIRYNISPHQFLDLLGVKLYKDHPNGDNVAGVQTTCEPNQHLCVDVMIHGEGEYIYRRFWKTKVGWVETAMTTKHFNENPNNTIPIEEDV